MSFVLDEEKTWSQRDFGLDARLLKALSKMGYIYPTLVQAKCIPIILQGKDALVRARTGSGKTIAFGLPLLHKLLLEKSVRGGSEERRIRSLILAPTKELCKQIEKCYGFVENLEKALDKSNCCMKNISKMYLLSEKVEKSCS